MDSGATPTGVHPRPSITLSASLLREKDGRYAFRWHAVKEGSHLGCEQERAASQKRFERKRGGKYGKRVDLCRKELIEAHDFKTDVLKVSREGRMGAVGR